MNLPVFPLLASLFSPVLGLEPQLNGLKTWKWKSLPSLSLLLFSHAQTSSNCAVGSWWWSVMGAHRKQNSQEGKTFLLHWSCGSKRVESTSIAFFPFCPALPRSWMKMQLPKCTAEYAPASVLDKGPWRGVWGIWKVLGRTWSDQSLGKQSHTCLWTSGLVPKLHILGTDSIQHTKDFEKWTKRLLPRSQTRSFKLLVR